MNMCLYMRMYKITGLFCRILPFLLGYFCKRDVQFYRVDIYIDMRYVYDNVSVYENVSV